MPGKELIDTTDFTGSGAASRQYVENDAGQLVTPEFLSLLQQTLSGKLAPPEDGDDVAPEVRALAEELSVIHLPEWQSAVGRKLADPTVTSIKQATRVAEYLIQRGVRVHPELEEIRWVATPSGPPGAFDTGMHITRDEHGQWPAPDPEEFYDLDDIEVRQGEDGRWNATHPRGLAFEAATRTEAYAGIVEQLRVRIDAARRGEADGDRGCP